MRATPMSGATTKKRLSGFQGEHKRLGDRINAMYLDKLDGRVDSTFFDKMSAQWREEQNRCLRELRGMRPPSNPTWMRVSRFSNSRGAPKSCSSSNNRAKNAGFSISYYRTALGRTAKWLPPSVNRLIYWRKPLLSQRSLRQAQAPIRLNRRFGWGTRIRT